MGRAGPLRRGEPPPSIMCHACADVFSVARISFGNLVADRIQVFLMKH